MMVFLKKYTASVYALVIPLVIFSILRLPSLVEPDWYGDEAIYQVVGMGINKGRLLYAGIWDNKPPFLYLIYALFDGNLFWVKLCSLLAGAASIYILYLISTMLFRKKRAQMATTWVYAVLFGLPLLEGNIANAENFMLFPILLAFLFFTAAYKTVFLRKKLLPYTKKKLLFFSGLFLSIAFSFKIVAIFDLAALLVAGYLFDHLSLSISFTKKMLKGIESEILLFAAFCILPVLTGVYFVFHHAFWDYFSAVFGTNVSYVDVNNYFYFPLGLVGIKVALLFITVAVIVYFRNKVGIIPTFIYLWTAFSVFNALFSQRPYTHYLLVLLPAFSLLIGMVFEYKKRVVSLLIIISLVLFSLLAFPLYFKVTSYYQNYAEFITGKKSVTDYEYFFDQSTPLDYETANIINVISSRNDSVLVLSDHAQIYALSHSLPPGKYITLYHMLFYTDALSDTKEALTKKKSKYIIQTQDSGDAQEFLDGYTLKYIIDGRRIYERKM